MHIVTKVYDDSSVNIFDLGNMTNKRYTYSQLENILDRHIFGILYYNNQILSIKPMKVISFPTEQEAIEYNQEYNGKIIYLHDYWWILYSEDNIVHVDYYVYTQVGEEITYVSKTGYTPYIQSAKSFNEVDAIILARTMTKNSKTGKYWKVMRVCED